MGLLGLAAVAALMAGCNAAFTEEQRIKQAVREQLIDPDSAKFEAIYKGKTEKHWCGMVNAKNRMGGYAGATPFVYEKVAEGFGFVSLVREPPDDYEFKSLMSTSSFEKEYKVLASKCKSIKDWNDACGTTPMESHEMCAPLIDPEEKDFVKKLYAKYKDR